MRPGRSLALGLALVALLATGVAVLGTRRRPTSGVDTRPSSLITEPNGARALADVLERLGVKVERLRRFELRPLSAREDSASLLVLLDPTLSLSMDQAIEVMEAGSRGVATLAAGPGARNLFRCLGYDTTAVADSVSLAGPGAAGRAPRIRLGLRPSGVDRVVDSSGVFDATITSCDVPAGLAVDTLATTGGLLAAIRLRPPDGAALVLVGDVNPFRNRTLRDTDAGALVVPWMLGRDRVWFDEVHHGFLAGGSLVAWTLRWSRESPWGWFAWHAAIVGLLALAAGAIRFGPPLEAFDRRRRSVTEHVRALALALRAAGGHGAAIGLLVSGVRRRLAPAGRSAPGPWQEWLAQVAQRGGNPRVARIGDRLRQLDSGRPSEREVLAASHLVEDLWNEMGS